MADSELSRLVADIAQVSVALTKEAGDLDSIIGNFEGILRRLNTAGLTVEIPLWDHPPPRVTRMVGFQAMIERREIFLVFAKSEADWRLQVQREIYVEEASPPASRASRNEVARSRLFV